MKLATIIGARPQFIKAALISRYIRKNRCFGKNVKEVLINTGQHYDYNMSRRFFEELDIPRPEYNLRVGPAPKIIQITEMMRRAERVLKKERPDAVLVYGDTNTTLAGALIAASFNIPIFHIEAGLRSYDRSMPEEVNRVLTDHLSEMLFCPTRQAVENLKKEGITKGVYLTGDMMYELALKMSRISSKKSNVLKRLELKKKGYILATIHRESNTDIKQNLTSIVNAFRRIKGTVVFPVHPRTTKMLKRFSLWRLLREAKNVKIIFPLGYMDMICLEKNASKIITDSGGVQKEAYFFKVPCITLRDRTEWIETLRGGWNLLVGADSDKILAALKKHKLNGRHYSYYGNGRVSEKIVKIISNERFE